MTIVAKRNLIAQSDHLRWLRRPLVATTGASAVGNAAFRRTTA